MIRKMIFLVSFFCVLVSLVLFLPGLVRAQSDCVWENVNCTPTPTATATPTGTPPATGTLVPIDFEAPEFGVPTSIPTLNLDAVPDPLEFTPIPAPSPITFELTPLPTPNFATPIIAVSTPISLTEIGTTIELSYTTPLTIDFSAGVTGTNVISGITGDLYGWLGEVVSYTNWLTGEIESLQGTEVITVVSSPSWYAPALPRPMADVGWTFETLTDPDGAIKNFTLSSWASFFGYVSTLPFQFIKTLWQIVAYFGPFGLFLAWLMIMFLYVVLIQLQVFLARFLITLFRMASRFIELLGEWAPTGG